MADAPDPGRLLTALTTEHFTLQGARSATTGEGAARSSLFLGSVSSALVALGFLASVSGGDSALYDDALGVLTNMGLRITPVQLYLTNSFAIGIVTAVLAGGTVALAIGVATGAPLGVDVAAGAALAVATVTLLMRFSRSHYGQAPFLDEPLFPSARAAAVAPDARR